MKPVKRERSGIYRRGKSWIVRVRRDGKPVWCSFGTKSEAEGFLAEARLRRARRQPEPAMTRQRFDEYATEWLAYMAGHVAPKTLEGYEGVLRVHLLLELGERLLTDITRRELDEILADWVAGGVRFQARVRQARHAEALRAVEEQRRPRSVRLGHSPKTVANAVVPLREMLGHAVEWGVDHGEPGRRAATSSRRAVCRADDARARRQSGAPATRGARRGTGAGALTTAVMPGARRGELLGVTWADVDRERGRLWIRRSLGGGGQLQQPKSPRSVRAIAMTSTLSIALRDHRMHSRFKAPEDYVFASTQGTSLDGRNVSRMFTQTLERAGLPRVRFHD